MDKDEYRKSFIPIIYTKLQITKNTWVRLTYRSESASCKKFSLFEMDQFNGLN